MAPIDFLPVPETQIPEKFLVQNRRIEVVSSLGVVDDQKQFLDVTTAKISTRKPVINRTKFWSYPQRGLAYRLDARTEILDSAGQIATTNNNVEKAYEVDPTRFRVPFTDLAYLQLSTSDKEQSPLRNLSGQVCWLGTIQWLAVYTRAVERGNARVATFWLRLIRPITGLQGSAA